MKVVCIYSSYGFLSSVRKSAVHTCLSWCRLICLSLARSLSSERQSSVTMWRQVKFNIRPPLLFNPAFLPCTPFCSFLLQHFLLSQNPSPQYHALLESLRSTSVAGTTTSAVALDLFISRQPSCGSLEAHFDFWQMESWTVTQYPALTLCLSFIRRDIFYLCSPPTTRHPR